MHYFAYGSNMSLARLQARTPSARRIGRARLAQHSLRFHKQGRDGSGKCDAYWTGASHHCVIGALYDLAEADKPLLDAFEGLGQGYQEKLVCVEVATGEAIEAFTYTATALDATLLPFEWYLNHVVVGAQEIGVPKAYLDVLQQTVALKDPDRERHAREIAIYEY